MSIKFLLSTFMLVCIAVASNGYNCNGLDYGAQPGNTTGATVRGRKISSQGRGLGNGDRSTNKRIKWCRKANTGSTQFPELAGAKGIYYQGSSSATRGIYTFGGYKESVVPSVAHVYSNKVYRYIIPEGRWTEITTTGDAPNPKAFHIVSYRSTTKSMIVALGGTFSSNGTSFESFPEIHSLSLETRVWTKITPNSWPTEMNAFDFNTWSYTNFPVGMVASNGFVSGSSLFVFGGIRIGDFSFQNDFSVYWVFDFVTLNWETVDGSTVQNFPVPGYDRSCAFDEQTSQFHCYGGESLSFDENFSPIYSIPSPIQFIFNAFTRKFASFAGADYSDGQDTLTPRNTGNNMAVLSTGCDSEVLLYGGDIGGIPAGQNCSEDSFLQNNVDDAWYFEAKSNGNKRWRFLKQSVSDGCANALPLNYKRGDSVSFVTTNGDRMVVLYGGWSYSLSCVQSFNRNAWIGRLD